MIEVTLTGTVYVAESHRHDPPESADWSLTSTVAQTVDIEATKEFPDGYVNLEGYALSGYAGVRTEDILHSFRLSENPALGGKEIVPDGTEVEVVMRGDWWDWAQQAVKYATERPSKSVAGCLSLFETWDETGSGVEQALDRLDGVPHFRDEVGDLSDTEWNRMVAAIHDRVPDRHPVGILDLQTDARTA